MRKINYGFVLAILFCVLVWALIGVGIAKAAVGDPRLDAIASQVAGHPVKVSCSTDAHDWAKTEDLGHLTFEADGFTFIGVSNVIYLSPRVCDSLEILENHGATPAQIGPVWLGLAVKTLLHESTHQGGIRDERTTDCTALSLLPTWLPKLGVPAKVQVATYVRKGTLYRRVVRTVSNSLYVQTIAAARVWHNSVPAFGGPC